MGLSVFFFFFLFFVGGESRLVNSVPLWSWSVPALAFFGDGL